ncbi:MAG: multidrug transporter [Anaerolineae bacterium]|nr:multidrug transporter [Anaerolineae bacterium]
MRRVALLDNRPIFPFNEPARELRVLNKPLKVHQQDVLVQYCDSMSECESLDRILRHDQSEMIVYRDNLFFDQSFIDAFIKEARKRQKPCRVAFSTSDLAITKHAIYLQDGIVRQDNLYIADLWYFPNGVQDKAEPLVIDTGAREIGYYHVPTYMASDRGEIVYYVPIKAFLSIEHWMHVFMANTPFGIFAEGARFEVKAHKVSTRLRVLLQGMWERKQVLGSSQVVVIGKNTHINPDAVIQGPAYIGDNCYIGPGVVIENCIIGNNVTLDQGVQAMLSVISDNCYLPFRAALFMTTLMERCIVAQNACLQMCVLGRNTFVGAGTTFTDFNLVPKPMMAFRNGRLEPTGLEIIGGCVGHNCRIGAGLVIYPARAIESDTILARTEERSIVAKNVLYEESDHHKMGKSAVLHKPMYHTDSQE